MLLQAPTARKRTTVSARVLPSSLGVAITRTVDTDGSDKWDTVVRSSVNITHHRSLTGPESEGYYRYRSGLDGSRGSLGEDVADTPDFGAYCLQFFFDVLVATVQVIDAVDDGFAVSDQRS
jgi:hypothetical protein